MFSPSIITPLFFHVEVRNISSGAKVKSLGKTESPCLTPLCIFMYSVLELQQREHVLIEILKLSESSYRR